MARKPVLLHCVLISFKPEVPQEKKDAIFERYQDIDQECGGLKAGILFWKVEHNLDLRKGVHLVECAIFRDNDALQAFRVHPKHKELTDVLRDIADWQVGDFLLPLGRLTTLLEYLNSPATLTEEYRRSMGNLDDKN